MINFRYHIVSLMAVFLALAVGIAAGVSLSPSVNEGVAQQAEQDRKQVTELRAELDRRNSLDALPPDLRPAGRPDRDRRACWPAPRVAIVQMPDAPDRGARP